MKRFIHLRAAMLALIALACAGATAVAQSGAPAPGCAGTQVTDPPDDASRLAGDAPDNFDITGVFFSYEGGKAYANMVTQGSGDALPTGATGARWYVYWTKGGQEYWVRATINNLAEPVFNFGHTEVDVDGTTYVSDGETTGKFHEGTPGVLQMAIPASIGGAPGNNLTASHASTAEAVNTPARNQLVTVDEAPDGDGRGKAYAVGACEGAGGATPTPTPDGSATPTPTPGSGGSGGGSGTPATKPDAPAQQGALAVTVGRPPKAKAAARKRKLVLPVASKGGEVKDLRATLFTGNGKKVAGKGALARLAGKGKLTIKVPKKFKRGRYKLTLTGTNPDGRAASLTKTLAVR